MQRAVRACLVRGGSSKGVFLHSRDLPAPGALRDQVVLRIFGSPDPRQIDGLGGADVLTSKLAIVGPPSVPGADVDYTFGQVSFASPQVDYKGNCGNISAGVGPFAVDEGLLPAAPGSGDRLVRIHNTNTGAILRATVPVGPDGRALVDGDAAIAGVPGTGARVDLDFSATQGSVTGALLPTGSRRTVLQVPREDGGAEELEATLLDAGQPTVFVHAAAFGVAGGAGGAPRTAEAILQGGGSMLRRVERLRGAAAVQMGIVERWADAERLSPYTPFVTFVERPPPGAGPHISATCVFMQQLHRAYPVTGSVATVAAALLPGTLAHEACTAGGEVRQGREPLRIGHPGGVMEVHGEVSDDGGRPQLLRASITRTARRLMDGHAYVPWSVWPS